MDSSIPAMRRLNHIVRFPDSPNPRSLQKICLRRHYKTKIEPEFRHPLSPLPGGTVANQALPDIPDFRCVISMPSFTTARST
ncbi:hypothetical protein, partial [Mesorhizobium sp. M4B.F.Ca.ET.143.01.1.1]|uniref:hypothetical protein n=1 Tax=Mesorhizobium sp. M4B.F.Ca.ET.143.01.1.1 TaxID=2563947 RepID=UPI001AEE2AA2